MEELSRQHLYDIWKAIEFGTGRRKFRPNWHVSGGYSRCNVFAKYFVQHCRYCSNSNAVKAKMKEIIVPTILWQGHRICYMKLLRTLQCKIFIKERKKILSRFRSNKPRSINDNSDIFSSYKCRSRFHKINQYVIMTKGCHPQK